MNNAKTHTLLTADTCNCGGKSGRCPVCDYGLGVCSVCGGAECQLDDYSCADLLADRRIKKCPHCNFPRPADVEPWQRCSKCGRDTSAKHSVHEVSDPVRDEAVSLRANILDEITEERERQIALAHGGDTQSFDKANGMNDWVAYITAYAGRAAEKVYRNQRESELNGKDSCDKKRFRENMVKVAALALAAIEAHENGYC